MIYGDGDGDGEERGERREERGERREERGERREERGFLKSAFRHKYCNIEQVKLSRVTDTGFGKELDSN